MNLDIKRVKITVSIPPENTDSVRNTVCDAGAGVIGNYTHCSVVSKCIGTFKPSIDANPYIGEKNKLEFVNEEMLEFVCDINLVSKVIKSLRKAHPYEEPAINIIPLLDENDFE